MRASRPLLSLFCLAACSTDGHPKDHGTADAGGHDAAAARVLAEIPCTDTLSSIYEDPGPLPGERGAIIRCATDVVLSRDALQERAVGLGYTTRPLTSGTRVYRLLYRTERGTSPPSAGYSSAIVYLPDKPRAERLPVLVASHGSRGQGPDCAPSKNHSAAAQVHPEFERLVVPLVGQGFAVMVPDLGGYANFGAPGNPISAYASADDAGRATLDGARALSNLIASAVTDQVVLVGHSLGGHSTLSALALAETYGAGGTIAAVATFAPMWVANRTWGALAYGPLANIYTFSKAPSPNAVVIWYHYTHGELLDGPGKGTAVFEPTKRDLVKAFVDSACWYNWEKLTALGSSLEDVFDPAFVRAVGARAAGASDSCPDDLDGRALCEKWMARYEADRPHVVGAAAKVPQVLAWGGKDETIPADRITCALDRLAADKVNLEATCVDPEASHVDVTVRGADYVVDWIAAKVLGGPPPAPCPRDATGIVDEAGKPATCNQVPPND
ncbi:MAG: hypothetical protein HY698_22495 [Deltaproteobacteria bacterium]|nr:hypothetical protein [Deltaproteobacteria bacterium]